MDFSIVVPVLNRPEAIRDCVASCYAIDYPPTRFEVLVVDNGSTDATAREAQGAGARVVSSPIPNRCLARNDGVRVARGRWIAFTDSDCVADRGWLRAFAEAAGRADEATVALAGDVVPAEPKTAAEAYIAARRWIDQEKFLAGAGPFSPPFAATANLAVRRDAFLASGGFDPDLAVAAEDADLCIRLARGGGRIVRVPDARVIHRHRSTTRGMLRQAYHYGVGNAELFAKHADAWGASRWIEPHRYVWAAKGFLKAPWIAIAARDPFERPFGLYDGLTNLAQAWGRFRGGRRRGRLVL